MPKFKSVMLIDDEHIINFINQKVIESINITERIESFTSAMHALDHYKLNHKNEEYCNQYMPQLILLDLAMPHMDGFEFLDAFDKLHYFKQQPIDIVMLSSSDNPADIEKATNHKNCFAYIIKPLTIGKLLKHLQ
jgi:CheY-like chemotaxis protein